MLDTNKPTISEMLKRIHDASVSRSRAIEFRLSLVHGVQRIDVELPLVTVHIETHRRSIKDSEDRCDSYCTFLRRTDVTEFFSDDIKLAVERDLTIVADLTEGLRKYDEVRRAYRMVPKDTRYRNIVG